MTVSPRIQATHPTLPSPTRSLLKVALLTSLLFSNSPVHAAAPTLTAQTTSITTRAEATPNLYVNANGVRLAYRALGPQRGVPLVLLQRLRGTLDDWDPAFLNALAIDRRVLILSNAGIGSSSGTVPTTIDGHANHAAEFIRALGLREADLLGWSMGGFVAQALAAQEPNLIRRVILLGTGPGGNPGLIPPPQRTFDVALKPTWTPDDHTLLFFTPTTTAARDASLKRIAQRAGVLEPTVSPQATNAQATAISLWLSGKNNDFTRLKTTRQPTLIVAGDRDAFFDVRNEVALYHELPNARLAILPQAGHAPHQQHPADVARLIRDFLTHP